jgi:hypothetical protein
VKDMTENSEELKKICPLCKKEYPGEDVYCGEDGSRLEALEGAIL